jgi:hypothetical protein
MGLQEHLLSLLCFALLCFAWYTVVKGEKDDGLIIVAVRVSLS